MEKSKIFLQGNILNRVGFFCALAILCGISIIFALPTILVILLLLLPSILVGFGDTRPGWSSLRTVVLFGLAAACHSLAMLWHSNQSVVIAVALVSDIRVLSIAWVSQAGGWLLTQLLPIAVARGLDVKAEMQVARLQRQRSGLIEKWHFHQDFDY